MPSTYSVSEIVDHVLAGAATERQKAVALHDYVRDHVQFGFNKYFDAADSDYTLAFGYGHCNPKSHLLVELFRNAGLESYQHFVVIPKEILRGLIPASMYWIIPAELSHSFVEVSVEGNWYQIDSHIVDTPLLNAALVRLDQENRVIGYGARIGARNQWNGHSNAFSQFDLKLMIEDHGCVEDLDAYFHSAIYRNRNFGIRFNTLFKVMGNFGVAPINAQIERVRRSVPAD